MKAKITKLFKEGVSDDKAKVIEVPCFAMDADTGAPIAGRAPTGEIVAMALNDNGTSVLPNLHRAVLQGFYAHGFRVSGYCDEFFARKLRSVYCEWWVVPLNSTENSKK